MCVSSPHFRKEQATLCFVQCIFCHYGIVPCRWLCLRRRLFAGRRSNTPISKLHPFEYEIAVTNMKNRTNTSDQHQTQKPRQQTKARLAVVHTQQVPTMHAPLSICAALLGCVFAGIFAPAPSADAFALSPPKANHHRASVSCFSASVRGPRGHPISVWMNRRRYAQSFLSSSSESPDSNDDAEQPEPAAAESIDITADPRLVRVRLPRATTVEWGTDLSFSFVYVRAMEPAGAADLSGQIAVNDQLCELRPVLEDDGDQKEGTPISLIGAPFDTVMSAFATLDKTVREVDLVFFRGTRDELKELCTGDASGGADGDTITITVIQNKGGKDEAVRKISAPSGCNVRQVLVDNGINVYQSVTRWTNCKGKQLCGTCIVNVSEGGPNTNRKSMDEASTLRENPDGYRLSCVTFAYVDVTVETFPPIKAAQWTR